MKNMSKETRIRIRMAIVTMIIFASTGLAILEHVFRFKAFMWLISMIF